ncbi:hypothetical protein ACUY4Q_002804 [Phytobacter sp. AG2a]
MNVFIVLPSKSFLDCHPNSKHSDTTCVDLLDESVKSGSLLLKSVKFLHPLTPKINRKTKAHSMRTIFSLDKDGLAHDNQGMQWCN